METRDDTIHPIQHVGNVPFGEEGNQTYIKDVTDTPTADLDEARMMGLLAMGDELGTRRLDEARNSGSWERRDEELKKLGTTQENEDKDEDQGDKMGRNEKTRLMCQ